MKKISLTAFEWTLVAGTILCPLLTAIFSGPAVLGDWEWWFTYIAAVLNIFCCVYSAKGSSWTFLFGSVYDSMYAVYCIYTHHYGNAAVYGIFFLLMQLLGYIRWRRLGDVGDSGQVAAKRLSWKGRIWLTLATLAGMAVLVVVLRKLGGSNVMVDAVCTALCIIAQLLLTLAYFEQWFIWIGVNVATIVLWAVSATEGPLSLSSLNLAICYFFVLLTSVNGLRVWYGLSKGREE